MDRRDLNRPAHPRRDHGREAGVEAGVGLGAAGGTGVIRYLLDASALWQIFRNPDIAEQWRGPARDRMFHVCEATRTEYLFSARGPVDRDEMAEDLDALCDLAPVPKSAWRWVDTAQYKLTQRGHAPAGRVTLYVAIAFSFRCSAVPS